MREHFELAEYLICGWALAMDGRSIPLRDGIIDQAMQMHSDRLPRALSESLSFGVTRVGFRCYELPEVVFAAQANLLAEIDTGRSRLLPLVNQTVARSLLRRRGIDVKDACAFARHLDEAIREIELKDDVRHPG